MRTRRKKYRRKARISVTFDRERQEFVRKALEKCGGDAIKAARLLAQYDQLEADTLAIQGKEP